MDFKALLNKKVVGVPVLYLAGAFVAILAVVAWRMKPAPEAAVTDPDADDTALDPALDDYAGLATNGTVTVVQGGTSAEEESKKETNDDWERAAVAFLISEKLATAGEAQTAINKYLEGADLSYDEGRLRDAAVTKLGIPPEKMSTVGTVGLAPAQRQFNNFPGTHTVKNVNDNTAGKLAQLYYGNSDTAHALKIAANNSGLGPLGVTYNVGTVVKIPRWENPRYYTITKTTQWPSQVAAKNGMSVEAFTFFNPGLVAPYKVGSKVRVG